MKATGRPEGGWELRCGVALTALLAVVGLHAPGGLKADEADRLFIHPLGVPLVTLDLVALDRDGNPVLDLEAEDFEVREDGVPVAISHFARVDAGPGAVRPETEPRFLVLYFDDTNVVPRRRAATLDHLETFLGNLEAPGVRIMVVRFDGALRIESEFSAETELIQEALGRVRARGVFDRSREADELVREMEAAADSLRFHERDSQQSGGTPGGNLMLQMIGDFGPRIDALAMASLARNRASLDGLSRLVEVLRGVPGRKAVLWVGSLETGTAEELFMAWRQLLPEQASRAPAGAAASSMRYGLTNELRDLAREASAHMVSFYGLGSTGASRGSRVSTETHSGVTSSGSGRAGESDPWSGQEAAAVLSLLTGGDLLRSGRGLDEDLDRVATDLGRYYSLGYVPETIDDAYHEIAVTVARGGVELLHRHGRRGNGQGRDMVERLTTAALVGVANDAMGLEISTRAQEPRAEGSSLVPVVIRIPIGALTLVPGARYHQAQVTVLSLVRDARGGLSSVAERTYPMEIANDRLLAAVGQRVEFVLGLVVADGWHRIAVGVRDDRSMTGSVAFLDLEVGSTAAEGPA